MLFRSYDTDRMDESFPADTPDAPHEVPLLPALSGQPQLEGSPVQRPTRALDMTSILYRAVVNPASSCRQSCKNYKTFP